MYVLIKKEGNNMKRKIKLGICTIVCAVAVAVVITNKNFDTDIISSQDLEPLSLSYYKEALEPGQLEVINYKTHRPGRIDHSVTKSAMVYLPYGYNKSKKYNIMYLMHGRGGSYKTWLGVPKRPHTFKNVMDNMIENGDVKPMIVVAPSLAYEFGTDNSIMIGTEREIVNYLMPAVESRFSTYAETATPKGFQASRNHRYFAGFSMGGSLTWHMLRDHVDYFRYFIPMSMATYYDKNGYSERKSIVASEKTKRSMRDSGYGPKDFEVFAATGNDDYKADATAMQVYDLTDDNNFIYTGSNFNRGNITFKIWPGEWHCYKNSYPYLYNALRLFK